ncbi:MAG: GNAT family N-acetyltransferase [Saprospiraceae bacterium]
MYFSQVDFGTPTYCQLYNLRNEILRKPLNLKFSINEISNEYTSFHFGLFNTTDDLLATLILKTVDLDTIKMRQVAVKHNLQKLGLGRRIVVESEHFCRQNKYKTITLNARIEAIPFYQKMGYKTDGNDFLEIGIKHYKMIKSLK